MNPKKQKAIALCRVSSDEQLKNNSLARQNEAVMNMAEKLGVIIPENYVWSGSVSSKKGKNVERKDLKEILSTCRRDKNIKYIIVDEPDRFMRSIEEAFYWETVFKTEGVKVMYTDESLNTDDLASKLLRFTKYLQAEGSNEERIKKSIEGHKKAIKDGRYPFVNKLGYMKGPERGVAIIDPVVGPLLKEQLVLIAKGLVTPTVALQDYNKAIVQAGLNKAPLKMDKWRKICTDPYYCGVVEMHKAVDAYNPNGLHEKLISRSMHEKIVDVFNGKPKNQKGPNTSGNPLYPFNQMITHVGCPCTKSKYNTFVGVTVKNGQGKEYEKYRCRGCYMCISREEMSKKIEEIISSLELTKHGNKVLMDALTEVFESEAGDIASKEVQLYSQRAQAKSTADGLMDQYLTEKPGPVKDEIKNRYEKAIGRIKAIERDLEDLEHIHQAELNCFIKYALDFVNNLVESIIKLSPHRMQLCKQLLFPDGFYVDENLNVYTDNISPIYRLKSIKKGSDEPSDSLMVRMKRL